MSEPAAPASGTPAAPAPGAAPATPPAGTPPAPTSEFKAPWSDVQGVYTIGEGDAAKPWYEGIQEEPIREYMKEKNYANPYEAARAAWNANKLNKLTPDIEAFVNGKATPEQEAAIYKMLGRPETPDAYEFKVPQGVETDPELVKFGKDLFYSMGLPPSKAQAAFDKWQEFATKANAGYTEAARVQNETELADLSKRWGPELEANRAAGNRAVQALGLSNDLIQRIEANVGSAAIVELLAAIGKKGAEGGFKGTGTNVDPNDPNTMTKEAAVAKIRELQTDTAFQKRYTDKTDPGHKDALTLMEKLFAKAG